MINIFKFFEALFIAIFKITGYTIVFVLQMIWYIIYRRKDKIADAFGDYGRSVTDTFGSVLKSIL